MKDLAAAVDSYFQQCNLKGLDLLYLYKTQLGCIFLFTALHDLLLGTWLLMRVVRTSSSQCSLKLKVPIFSLQAITLSDGTIFVSGGVGEYAQEHSELWSPTAQMWVLAPPMLSSSIDNGLVR